jgi:hypothetical protein
MDYGHEDQNSIFPFGGILASMDESRLTLSQNSVVTPPKSMADPEGQFEVTD